jgi:HlyD family secretion protein
MAIGSKRRSTITGLVLLVVAGGGGWWAWKRSSQPTPVTFRTVRVERGAVESTVTATGALNAVVTVQVGSQVSGTIAKLGADFNSQVTQGQVIAQIDPTRFRANVAQAESNLKSAEAALVRAKVNQRQAKIELDRATAAEAQVGQSRAQVGMARYDLEHTTIRAPISGTVLQRSIDVGQTVAASLQAPVLFTIAQDLSRMEVHVAVDEADVGKLREGQEATFTVDAYPGEAFKGTIFQIRSQPTVTQNVVTYDAVLRVDNKDGKLRPGMTASVRAVSQRHEGVLRISNSAMRFRPTPDLLDAGPTGPGVAAGAPGGGAAGKGPRAGGGEGGGGGGRTPGGGRWAKAYLPAGQKVSVVRFKPGISDDEFTEIVGGNLKEGDEVVLDASGGGQPSGPPGGGMGGGGKNSRGPRFF